jgi:hypothetical protein
LYLLLSVSVGTDVFAAAKDCDDCDYNDDSDDKENNYFSADGEKPILDLH